MEINKTVCQVKVNLERWVSSGITTDVKFTTDRDDCPYFKINDEMPNDIEIDPGPEVYTCLMISNAFNGQCPYFMDIKNSVTGLYVVCNGLVKK